MGGEAARHGAQPVLERSAGPPRRWRGLPFRTLKAALGVALRLTPLHDRGRRNALDVRRVEFDVVLPGLPHAFDGYRILHVSDPHLDRLPELVDAARRASGDLAVDMLAMTGDVCGYDGVAVEHATALLMDALSGVEIRGPRLAVLGNHDPVEMVGALERAGLDVPGQPIDGRDTRWRQALRHRPRRRQLLLHRGGIGGAAGSRRRVPHRPGPFGPTSPTKPTGRGYALYLCGHTHGGQICLPGGRPIFTQLLRCKHAASGLWRQGRMAGYTNRGLGVSVPLLRFNTRGEVAVITLRAMPTL